LRSPVSPSQLRRIVKTVLRSCRRKASLEIPVVFVDNRQIRALSRKFIGEDHETDVIAFPYDDPNLPFGELYISLPMAKHNAMKFKQPYKAEVVRLIVHGTLHLLGYDDHKAADKKMMWAKQEKLVAKLLP
jgi:probable rRNA maturation factor